MSSTQSPLVSKALAYAAAAHGSIDHVRKYTGEPYIHHPIEVMEIVSSVPHTEDMLAAALLHDTIADTAVTQEDINREIRTKIATQVMDLTDQCPESNRSARKPEEAVRLSGVSRYSQTHKMSHLL